jgi:Subtilase family
MRRKYSSLHWPLRTSKSATVVRLGCLLFGALWLISLSTTFGADPSVPANIDSHLQRLVQRWKSTVTPSTTVGPQTLATPLARPDTSDIPGRFDANGRVLVHIHLDGTQSIEAVERALNSEQIRIQAKNASYRHGIMAAYLTPAQVEAAARLAGVRAVTMEGKPHANVGAVTSEGTVVLKTDLVNKRGIKGDGITVGVLSDSFNTAYLNVQSPPATTAAQDVQTGDLPVVNVLEDFDNGGFGGTDEGRAMCQIVYDLAPHSNLAFATAFVSEVDFANNIVALRAEANCDVIVDDISYSDDPVFSDGLLAQAVNTVASSTSLPGHPAVYCSSAGNEGDNGYISTFRDLTDKFVRTAGNHGNLKLEQVEPALTAGGWHNWNPNGGKEPVTTIIVPGAPSPYNLFLQWDDAFDQAHGITTSFNILVFDQAGNYHPELSGTSDAFSIQQAYQQTGNLLLGTTYQLAITKTRKNDPLAPTPPAAHQLSIQTFLDGIGNLSGKYFHASPLNVRTTYGHAAANGAIDVAAYVYDWTDKKPFKPVIEPYTSPGPVVIYFDQNGNRLQTPEVRAKPEVAGVDGVGTTFFGGPYQSDQFAFFGTSAAAPHIAGVAALIIQAAGGAGSIDPGTVKFVLEATTPARDIDPLFSLGLGASSSGFVSVSAQGSVTDGPNYFTVFFLGAPGQSLESLTIDASKGDLIFDTSAGNPPPTVGTTRSIAPGDVSFVTGPASPRLTLNFTPGKFVSGDSVSFTIDQDNALTRVSGGQSDYLGAGTKFTATFGPKKDTVIAAFQNTIGFGFNQADGFGLVDAEAAVQFILGSAAKPAP